jgi:PAS domain S-box-containing protein
MKNKKSETIQDNSKKIEKLARLLRETERELRELTGGEVDAFTQADGKPYLLAEAQEKLRVSEAAQRGQAQTQASILNALPAMVALLDSQGIILAVNDSWRKFGSDNDLLGSDYFVGQNYLTVCDDSSGKDSEYALQASQGIRGVIAGRTREFNLEYPCHAPEEKRWFRMIVTRLHEDGKEKEGVVVTHLNITVRKLMEDHLLQREALLSNTQRIAGMGSFETDLKTGVLTWSDSAYEIYGIKPKDFQGTYEHFTSFIPTEDQEVLSGAISKASPKNPNFEGEYRFRRPDGEIRWIFVRGQVEYDGQGNPVRRNGMVVDITQRKLADQILEEKDRRYREIVETSNELIWVVSPQGKITFMNRASKAILGWAPEELTGRHFLELVPEDQRQDFSDSFDEIPLSGNGTQTHITKLLRKDRSIVTLNNTSHIIRDSGGGLVEINGVAQDISESIDNQEKLRLNEQMLRVAGKISKLGGWSVQLPERRITWSDEVCAIQEVPPGTSPDLPQALGYYTPESEKLVQEAFERCAREGIPYDLELELITAKGRKIWVRTLGQAEKDQAGRIIRVQGALQDIHDRKEEEIKLERANRSLQMLSECNEALIHSEEEMEILNEICRIIVEIGGHQMAWVGYAAEDEAKTIVPVAHFGTDQDYFSKMKVSWDGNRDSGRGPAGQVIRTGQPVVAAHLDELEKVEGFDQWLAEAKARHFQSLVCLPLKDKTRTFGILNLYHPQISNHSPADIRLLQELADDLAFGILTLRSRREKQRLQESVLAIARGVSGTVGLEFFEQLTRNLILALGAHIGFIALLESPPALRAKTVCVVVDGQRADNFEYPLEGTPCEQVSRGEGCVVENGSREKYPGDPFIAKMGIDGYVGIPLKTSAEKIIGLIAVLFRGPLPQKDFIVSTLQIFAARAASELERQSADQQVREQAALLDSAHEAILVRDLEDRIFYWNKGAEKIYGWTSAEVLGKKMGESFYKDVAKHEAVLKELFKSGIWVGEIIKKNKNNGELTVEASYTLVRDEEGRPKSILAIDNDVTERKKLEAQFLRAQRMDSIGTLAGGIAHDLNNILAPIMMTADLMKMDTEDPEQLKLLETIKLSAKRGAEMVKQVLSFSRGFEGEKVQVNMGEVVRELKLILNDTFPKNIKIEVEAESNLWPVLADPSQLNQVVLNLCVNARDAMPNGGAITIKMENHVLDSLYTQMNPGSKPGTYLLVKVTDTGGGIPREIQERIFDPFFTTKETGKGTGLGLSTVLGIVKSLGGFINLYSEMGRGSTFKIYLPASASEVEQNAKAVEQFNLPRGRGELILIVDDEEIIRVTVKKTLERFGYRVQTAGHGAEAVALYSKMGDSISAVITDMSMPIMDGPSTILALRSLDPNVVIIGSSGFHTHGQLEKGGAAGVRYFISKPYSAEAVLNILRKTIDESVEKNRS